MAMVGILFVKAQSTLVHVNKMATMNDVDPSRVWIVPKSKKLVYILAGRRL